LQRAARSALLWITYHKKRVPTPQALVAVPRSDAQIDCARDVEKTSPKLWARDKGVA
jgi:hypothetical protein